LEEREYKTYLRNTWLLNTNNTVCLVDAFCQIPKDNKVNNHVYTCNGWYKKN